MNAINNQASKGETPLPEQAKNYRLVLESEVYINSQIEEFDIPVNSWYLSKKDVNYEEAEYQVQFVPDYSRICFNIKVIANYKTDDGYKPASGEIINNLLNILNNQ